MSKLLDETRAVMRMRHSGYKTEKIYIYWMYQYFHFHGLQHPNQFAIKPTWDKKSG